jgi:hypothetical protein
MKKSLLILFVICLTIACRPVKHYDLPYNEAKTKIAWMGTVKEPGVSQKDISTKVIQWSIQNGYQLEKQGGDSYVISLTGSILSLDKRKVPFRLYFFVHENEFQFEITDVSIYRRTLEYFYTWKKRKVQRKFYKDFVYLDKAFNEMKDKIGMIK